jgi:hypothetical protein
MSETWVSKSSRSSKDSIMIGKKATHISTVATHGIMPYGIAPMKLRCRGILSF